MLTPPLKFKLLKNNKNVISLKLNTRVCVLGIFEYVIYEKFKNIISPHSPKILSGHISAKKYIGKYLNNKNDENKKGIFYIIFKIFYIILYFERSDNNDDNNNNNVLQ